MTSIDLLSFSEEFIFLNRFTRSVIYAGLESVDMSLLKLNYTNIKLTNWSSDISAEN